MSEFDPNALPTFAFIAPDLCHDGHDCGDDVVDEWARSTLQPVLDQGRLPDAPSLRSAANI